MTAGVLLDSHSMLWYGAGHLMRTPGLAAIGSARSKGILYCSHITIWEMGAAQLKKVVAKRPDLGGRSSATWFEETSRQSTSQALAISAEIAAEAGRVPGIYGSGDPGDCFLIATARIHNLTLVTRDQPILDLASSQPSYLFAVPC